MMISIIIGASVGERIDEVIMGAVLITTILSIIIVTFIGIRKLYRLKKKFLAVFLTIIAIPLWILLCLFIYVLLTDIRSVAAVSISLLIISNIIYLSIIKTYTPEGRKIKDEIEGFKLFIKTVEGDEGFDKKPETFDKYFPYAYVLGLENKWANKFEEALSIANYTPDWCDSTFYVSGRFNAVAFTSGFSSSFSSSMSSATSAPGSSSGSGGGGFSGGGRRPVDGGGGW